MRTVDLSRLVQVAGPLQVRGTVGNADLTPRFPALHNPFPPGPDRLAHFRRWLWRKVRDKDPAAGAALREVCELAVALRKEGPAFVGDPAEVDAELGPVLGYWGRGEEGSAEVVAGCVDWLLATGRWTELPR